MNKFEKITVIGAGYVGSSIAALFGQRLQVTLVDIDEDKLKLIKNNKSPIQDPLISKYLQENKSHINAREDLAELFGKTDLYVVALPSNYDETLNHFNTETIEKVLTSLTQNEPNIPILVRSTVPVGFTDFIKKELNNENIIFSPEFLREGLALHDNLNPSRIIIGDESETANDILKLLKSFAENNPPCFKMASLEAESVKLFSNSFLALRVAYFNELDSFCMKHSLRTKKIIEGVCSDERIGDGYNNPSFGYGGYCLPKDTKQLLANYDNVPQKIIEAIVNANSARKAFISSTLSDLDCNTYGIFRLAMKKDSDNIRESSTQSIVQELLKRKKNVLVYEPLIETTDFKGASVEKCLEEFKMKSDIIIANRISQDLDDVAEKVFTRDVFQEN